MQVAGKSLGGSLSVPCVQELAKESLVEAPSRYVRPNQDPIFVSGLSATQTEVPIIDMQRLLSEESANSELERLHIACKDWGFFQMINHGVSCSLIEKVKEEIQGFFDLPMGDKKKFWQEAGDLEGFGQAYVISEEQKLDWADAFYLVTLPHHLRKPHLLPKLPLPFSIEHRAVVNSEKERLSIGTFFTPKLDGDFGPAPSIISPETPPRFARVTVVDFLRNLYSKELDSKTNVDQYYI
nr:protein SRG1-like [Tanacetum cinerariifolium]